MMELTLPEIWTLGNGFIFVAPSGCRVCEASETHFMCSCRAARYCGKECYSKGWLAHKPTCTDHIKRTLAKTVRTGAQASCLLALLRIAEEREDVDALVLHSRELLTATHSMSRPDTVTDATRYYAFQLFK